MTEKTRPLPPSLLMVNAIATTGEEANEVGRITGKCVRFTGIEPVPNSHGDKREVGKRNLDLLRSEILDLMAQFQVLCEIHEEETGDDSLYIFRDWYKDVFEKDALNHVEGKIRRYLDSLKFAYQRGTVDDAAFESKIWNGRTVSTVREIKGGEYLVVYIPKGKYAVYQYRVGGDKVTEDQRQKTIDFSRRSGVVIVDGCDCSIRRTEKVDDTWIVLNAEWMFPVADTLTLPESIQTVISNVFYAIIEAENLD